MPSICLHVNGNLQQYFRRLVVPRIAPLECHLHDIYTLFVFVCGEWCSTHIVVCFCFGFLVLCTQLLPVSLDRPFLIAPSLFSNVYFILVFINIYLKFSLHDQFGGIFWNYLIDIMPKCKYKCKGYLCDMEHKFILFYTDITHLRDNQYILLSCVACIQTS